LAELTLRQLRRRWLWLRTFEMSVRGFCYAVAAGAILILLANSAVDVIYLLDLINPLTQPVRDFLWSSVTPESHQREVRVVRKVAGWMGALARGGLSYTSAHTQAVTRLVLLDGAVLLSLMALSVSIIVLMITRYVTSYQWHIRYVTLPRTEHNAREQMLRRLSQKVADLEYELAATRQKEVESARMPTTPPLSKFIKQE
jgi:hypothetical protein